MSKPRLESSRRLCGFFVFLAAAVFLQTTIAPAKTVAAVATPKIAQASPVRTSSILGTVEDEAGHPIASAKVSITGPVRQTTTTSAEGAFVFSGLSAGTYLVTTERIGYSIVTATISVSDGASQSVTFTLDVASQTTLRPIGRVAVARAGSGTQLNRTPASINTVDQQTYIDRAQSQVSNLLEELPGVELQRFSSGGGPGANTVAALRGADPAETQTLIDGHPVSGGPQSNYLIQFLNPLLLSDIEVVKGPGAFGNQINSQVNGSINFRTPGITRTFGANLTGGYDTYDGSTLSALVSDTIGKVGFLAGYARFGTPGYNTLPILSVAANASAQFGAIPDATATQYINASQAFNNHSELLKLDYSFSPATALTLGYFGLHTYADYTGNLDTLEPFHIVANCPMAPASFTGNTGPGSGFNCTQSGSVSTSYTNPSLAALVGKTVYASGYNNDNLYQGNFETDNEPLFTADLRTAFGPGSLLARYYATSIARDLSDPGEAFQPAQCDDPTCSAAIIAANGDYSGAYYQTQTDILHGADFQYALPVGADSYTVSYDTHGDRTTSCSGGQAKPGNCGVPGTLQTSRTYSVRGDLRFGSKLGVQVANYFSNATFVGSRYDPRLGITYQPNANAAFRAAFGSGFVPPSAQTAYDVTPHLNRNTLSVGPAIKPETSVSYQIGGDLKTGSDSKLTADAYVTRLFNRFASVTETLATPITFAGTRVTKVATTFNEANALQKGIELTYLKEPLYGIGATAYVNFLRAYAGNSDFTTNQIGTIYGNQADGAQYAGYPYTHGRAALTFRTRNDIKGEFGMSYYGALNSFNEPAFTLFDANVHAKLRSGLDLIISGQNLFNHDNYRTFGIYGYGYAPPQGGGGGFAPTTLFFAPPRQFTLELQKMIGAQIR